MTTLRVLRPLEDADETDGYDARLARLNEEIDSLEEELSAGCARLQLLRRQTEVLERAARPRRDTVRCDPRCDNR